MNSANIATPTPEQIERTARQLRDAEARDHKAADELQAFCDQMAWNATLDALQQEYGIDPRLISPRGKSRWTNRGLFEGPISILGMKVETRAHLTEVEDAERFLGYRTEKRVVLVRMNFMAIERPVTRGELAKHLEKAARRAKRKGGTHRPSQDVPQGQ